MILINEVVETIICQFVLDYHFSIEKFGITITWIPREINIVADKVAKLQPTKKDDTFYTIDFIYDLIFPDIENVNEQKNTKNAPESKLQNNNTKKIEK